MAYGSLPGGNNPKVSANVPPVTEGQGSGKAGPQAMRQIRRANPQTRMLLAASLGLVSAFVFFKARAVMYRSEDAKRRTTYNKDGNGNGETGFEGERKKGEKDKSYHVTVERSGGGI